MTNPTPYYGMFTDEGNAAVHNAISAHIERLYDQLPISADHAAQLTANIAGAVARNGHREAADTAVREYIYAALSSATGGMEVTL